MGKALVALLCLCSLTLSAALSITLPPPNALYYNGENTTEGSPFQKNARQVMQFLVTSAPLDSYALHTYGSSPDEAYGLAACFNTTAAACSTCLTLNRDDMIADVPLALGAQLLLSNTNYSCYLRYENYSFVKATGPAPAPIPPSPAAPSPAAPTELPPANTLYYNRQNTTQGSTFQKNARQLLQFLVTNVPSKNSGGYTYGTYPDEVYGFAACFNSTPSACSTCLALNRDEMISTVPLSVGARQFLLNASYSCYLRYESSPFVMAGAPAFAPVASMANPPVSSSPAPTTATMSPVNPAAPPPLSNSAFVQHIHICSWLLMLLLLNFTV